MGDSPLRILHVQQSLGAGGMENGVVNVANVLNKQGFDFHACCLTHRGELAERMPRPDQVKVIGKKDGFSLKTIWQLRKFCRKVKPHVIHSHNYGALVYSSLASGFGRSFPILHGIHGQPQNDALPLWVRLTKHWFENAPAKTHTVSHGLRQYFLDRGADPSNLIALVNGVDTDRFQACPRGEARAQLQLPDNAPVLIIVGRLIASKQHRLLFQAFEDIVAKWPDAVLCVVGDGGDEADAIKSAAAASPVAKQIRMEGYQPEPLPYYQAADLLVAPSTIEGLSNVVLEAMSVGLPALAHNACGNGEVIEHLKTGVVSDLSTREKLAKEIIDCLEDPQAIADMGKEAAKEVRSRFSLESMADSYADVYRSIARVNPNEGGSA